MNKIKKTLLFNVSCLALVVTALSFGTRGGFITPWMDEFNLTGTQVGWIVGTAFWGFTLAMVFLGPLVDILGIGKVLAIAFVAHVIGLTMTIFASGFWTLFFSTMLIGIANGSVEAAANPLVTALYPDDKTAKLNRFHMWFPTGIVIGGLIVFFLDKIGIGWRIQTAVMLIPTLGYGFLFFRQKFPETERVTVGASYKDMLKAVVTPLFLFMAFCMLFTAATELGTNQWIAALFNHSVSNLFGEGVGAILILVWISAIMALARLVAGPVVHRLSGIGVLLFSAFFSGVGLYLMSISSGVVLFASATVFALGIGFFWPNMLGVVAERIPNSGALGLAIMGGIGFLGGAIAQPALGKIYDVQMNKFGDDLVAGAATLQYVIILTAFLTLAFLYLFLKYRKKTELKQLKIFKKAVLPPFFPFVYSNIDFKNVSMFYILLIGLAAGAIAGLIMRGKGYGFFINLIIGIVGAYFGKWLFDELGIHIRTGIIGTLIVAVFGAVVLLFILNLLKKILDK